MTREKLIDTIDRFLSGKFDGDEMEIRDSAIELLLAIEASGAVVVPRKATRAMCTALEAVEGAARENACEAHASDMWDAMLSASPYAKEPGNG